MIRAFKRLVSSLLIVCLAGLSLPVHAGMLPTDADRAQIFSWLDRDDVRTQLQAYGVTPTEVKARVAVMTDDEAAQLAAEIDSLPAGGADILGVALAVFIILLITDILGFTKVFPFTRSIRK
jgi:uncharacterized protein DUF6627